MTGQSLPEEAIFLRALDITSVEDRNEYLDEACGDNALLRAEVERLLRAHEKSGDLLDLPESSDAPIDQPFTERPGDSIGPYKLLQQIGEGGMGVVYMAEQTEPVERRVALKVIKPGMDTRQVIRRFEAERQALALMDHPNIAKVLDAGNTKTGRPYFVMELVHGAPITRYCDEKQLTPRERLELFVSLCQAVQYAHQKGIIHRDLKPSNVLVALYDDLAVPKIIDFGVAKATAQRLTEKTLFTEYGQVVGTPEYMSPEQAQLNHLDIDTRTDVYSLGVLLYELLTGGTPFDRERLHSAAFDELLRIIREEEPPRPSLKLSTSESLPAIAANRHVEPTKLSTMVHGELDWIVMKALEKDRRLRYETASKFAEDVEHYLHDEAVSACPPSRAYKFRKFTRRNKAVIVTTAAIAAALIIGAGVATWQAVRATHERDRAVAAEAKAQEAAEHAETEAAISKAVNDFLQEDLLGMGRAETQAEAKMSPDPNIKLRTLLDRAAEKIDARFADQPLVQAAICHSIGLTYESIGAYEPAESLLRRAVDIRRGTLGEEHPDTLTSMNNLAGVFSDQAHYKEAEILLVCTLDIQRRTLGEEHAATLRSMQNLATIYAQDGLYDKAETLCEKVLNIQRRTLGDEHPHTLANMQTLANIYQHQGRYQDAEDFLRQMLEILRRTLGDEHPDTLKSVISLANVYNWQGRYDEAETLNRQTLDICCRALGEAHPTTIITMSNLADSCKNQGRYKEAEKLWRRALQLERDMLGVKHPVTVNTLLGMSDLSWLLATMADPAKRDPPRAVELAELATEIQPDQANCWDNLGVALYRNGQYSEAVEALEKARDMRGGEDAYHQFFLAMGYWQTDQHDKALQNYEEAVAWLGNGDRNEEQCRFKSEAERLIKPNQVHDNGQEKATNK